MSNFGGYARYYDLLYRDKDYAAEAAYAVRCLRSGPSNVRRILELGCGSGTHALEFARMGYALVGVDRSEAMLAQAEARRQALEEGLRERLRFQRGDVRTCRLHETFDALLALFHVVSYQTTNADLAATLATAAAHLRPGALFVFDFWYGAAVLAERPEVRVKRIETEELELVRIAEPQLRENEDCVDVHYTLFVRERRGGQIVETLSETHAMRYFFLPELELALGHAGLELVSAAEMASGEPLGLRTWSGCATARKL